MTVGIAAICKVGPADDPTSEGAIILTADRMLTDTRNDREFEMSNQTKLFKLTTHIGVLVSGDGERFLEICRRTQAKIGDSSSVASAVGVFSDEFLAYRNSQDERRVLGPYGLTLESFHARQRQLEANFVARLIEALSRERFGDALIAGIDESGAHIFTVVDPGRPLPNDQAGFAAIGTGAAFAEAVFEIEGYDGYFDWSAALLLAHAARREAEAAAGVGQQADMWIISKAGGIFDLTSTGIFNHLDKLYGKRRKRQQDAVRRDHAALSVALEKVYAPERDGETGTGASTNEVTDRGGSSGAPR